MYKDDEEEKEKVVIKPDKTIEVILGKSKDEKD
jgi:hypothetical protein